MCHHFSRTSFDARILRVLRDEHRTVAIIAMYLEVVLSLEIAIDGFARIICSSTPKSTSSWSIASVVAVASTARSQHLNLSALLRQNVSLTLRHIVLMLWGVNVWMDLKHRSSVLLERSVVIFWPWLGHQQPTSLRVISSITLACFSLSYFSNHLIGVFIGAK